MTIFAVVPVHNRIELTLQFLDSLDAQQVQEVVEVIVVDDGSSDGTKGRLDERPNRHRVRVIQGNGKLWWGGCVWKAIRWLQPRVDDEDWVFLANNDTVLDPRYLTNLLDTARTHPGALVGGRSFELWPDGSHHPVSTGFMIDTKSLVVRSIDGAMTGVTSVDALAGRGLLIPAAALPHVHMHQKLMPQHFADLHLTSKMTARGFRLLADHRAESMQLDRASSAVEHGQQLSPSFRKSSPMYVPALATFWWLQTPATQRVALPWRVLRRIRE